MNEQDYTVYPEMIEEIECDATRNMYQQLYKSARKCAIANVSVEFDPVAILQVLHAAQCDVTIPQRTATIKNKLELEPEQHDTSVL